MSRPTIDHVWSIASPSTLASLIADCRQSHVETDEDQTGAVEETATRLLVANVGMDSARDMIAAADAGHVPPVRGNPVRCSFCRASVPSTESAIAAGWIPGYYDGEDQCPEPACPACVSRRLRVGADGEFETVYPSMNEAY